MTLIQTPQEIFADAKAVQASALERVAAGDICDGVKKAWCATKRATEGPVTSRYRRDTAYNRSGIQQTSRNGAGKRGGKVVAGPLRIHCALPASRLLL